MFIDLTISNTTVDEFRLFVTQQGVRFEIDFKAMILSCFVFL